MFFEPTPPPFFFFRGGGVPMVPKVINIINIFYFSAVSCTFLKHSPRGINIFNISVVSSVLLTKNARNKENVKGVPCLALCGVPWFPRLLTLLAFLTSQQFRTHFSKRSPRGLNIFNVSAVSSFSYA